MGILYSSLAQAPKSTFLQRSEQNGRTGFSRDQGTRFPHVGQATLGWLASVIMN